MGVTQELVPEYWQVDATREATYAKVIDSTVGLLLQLVTEGGLWNWTDGCGGWLFGLIEERAAEMGLPLPAFVRSQRPVLLHLLERDGPLCRYCGAPTSLAYPDPHIDHVVPKSKGGGNELTNLVIACPPCNLSKGSKLLEDWKQ